MKKKILTLLVGAAVVGTKPASAMLEGTSKTEALSHTALKANVPQEVRDQIRNVGKYADHLIGEGKEVYLILGSANVEIEALQDSSKAKHWVFWNLSSHEGGKSNPALNAFIDVDFNDKDILQYASTKLQNKLMQIVIPELVLDYVKWGKPEFALWHSMLSDRGALIFADLNLGNISPQVHKVSENVASIDTINALNRFDLSYEDRDQYLADTYQKNDRPGFLTIVQPRFQASDKTLDLSSLHTADSEKVTEYVNAYLQLVNDPEYKDVKFETATWNIYNKARSNFINLKKAVEFSHHRF